MIRRDYEDPLLAVKLRIRQAEAAEAVAHPGNRAQVHPHGGRRSIPTLQ
jgi:hypothetical protein